MPAAGVPAAIDGTALPTAPVTLPPIETAKDPAAVPLRRHTGSRCNPYTQLYVSRALLRTVRHLHRNGDGGGTQWLEIAFNLNWKPTMI